MESLHKIIEKIVINAAGIIPVFWCDQSGIFKNEITGNNFSEIKILRIESPTKIKLKKFVKNANDSELPCVIYTNNEITIDSYIASNKLRRLDVTPHMLLNNICDIQAHMDNNSSLTNGQYKIFVKNFENVIKKLLNKDIITTYNLKNVLATFFMKETNYSQEVFVDFLNGNLDIDEAKSIYLYDEIRKNIMATHDVDISLFDSNKDLITKILLSLLKIEIVDRFPRELNDNLIDVDSKTLKICFAFIIKHESEFIENINDLNEIFKTNDICELSYSIPEVFINYISHNIGDYKILKIDYKKLWDNQMQEVGEFIKLINDLEKLLDKYVTFSFPNNTMNDVIDSYKKNLYKIDMKFRQINVLYENISYNRNLFTAIENAGVLNKISRKYFNVTSNINGKYIMQYSNLINNLNGAIPQSKFIKITNFREKTIFVFSDGLRYELAKDLLQDFKEENIIDYNVYSLLPTETEVCMNGFVIEDEKVVINSKDKFILKSNENKSISKIKEWRATRLSNIINSKVISFDEFKTINSYNQSVICFYDDVDISIHKLDEAGKVTNTLKGLKRIIDYGNKQGYDVVLLSDHGFIEVEEKILLQSNPQENERKKGRYLILSDDDVVDTMLYNGDILPPDFVNLNGRKFYFVNSVNSLKATSRYTHGGVSLQENIISAFLIKADIEVEQNTDVKHINNLSAFNEIKADVINAKDGMCGIYFGNKKIYYKKIDKEEFRLEFSIREYEYKSEFLVIVLVDGEKETELVIKSSNAVIDKDLNIF